MRLRAATILPLTTGAFVLAVASGAGIARRIVAGRGARPPVGAAG